VVVTGGAGFIGSHLCDALLMRGCSVTCIDNLVGTDGTRRNVAHLADHPRFTLLVDDILSWSSRADLSGVSCVFHLAAAKNSVCMDDPERDLAVNGLATLRLLRLAARDGVGKFVHSSTGSVVGETTLQHSASVPTLPVSYYGVSKLAGESYCRVVGDLTGLDYTILRYYHVIGPRQDGSAKGGVVPIFVRQALSGEPLTVDGDGRQTRSFTSVHDTVRANLIAWDHPEARGKLLHCASAIKVSVLELAQFILHRTASRSEPRHGPSRPGDIRNFEIDNSALKQLGLQFDTDWRSMVDGVIAASAATQCVA